MSPYSKKNQELPDFYKHKAHAQTVHDEENDDQSNGAQSAVESEYFILECAQTLPIH